MTGTKLFLLISTAFVLAACGTGQGGGGLFGTRFVDPDNVKSQSPYQLTQVEKKALETEVRKGIGFGNATYLRGRQRKITTKDGHLRIDLCAIMDLHRKTVFGGAPINYLVRAHFTKGQHKGMYVRVPSGVGTIAVRKDCKQHGLFPG